MQALLNANGEWVSGRYFLRELYLSQYHARIWELQQENYNIKASDFTDEFGFKSYCLYAPDTQKTIATNPERPVLSDMREEQGRLL